MRRRCAVSLNTEALQTPLMRAEGVTESFEARRFGPDHGERGQAGRKRGELKFVRGLIAHAGTGQWLGSYRQPGNGTLVEEIDEVKRVEHTLDAQLADRLKNSPVMRIDGEGGEVPVINGVDEAGFVPLVRLKQYTLLERSDVKRAIANADPVPDADGSDGEDTPSCRPQMPELDRTVRRSLEIMGMCYDAARGIIVCASGHHLVPKEIGQA